MNSIGRSNLANREKWLEEILRKIPKGLTILDAGASELRYKKFCSHLNYVSQDFGEYNGNGDGFGMQTGEWDQTRIDILCDIINIPVMDNSYDAIMCIEVFEHLPDPVKAINEFSRILKPNGYLIITAPFISLTHFAPFHFATGFNKYFYRHHLSKFNFNIIEEIPNGNFYESIAQEIRRVNFVVKTYSGKKLNIWDKFVIFLTLNLLEKYEKYDINSSDILNYGYHILAIKK